MFNYDKQQTKNDRQIDDAEDCIEQSDRGDCPDDSMSAADASSKDAGTSSGRSGLTERLTKILVDDGDGDLLLQQNDGEDNLLQWLRALDVQVIGACRTDERLKPLLKLNASTGAAEDRLLAHLSQHFEPSEVGMLARCLCLPLVSIRVGKINKQGRLLCPTATRGNLNLTLLPTSNLRISFVGDDGLTETLATLRCDAECFDVEIEEIKADNSGRSFSIKVSDGEILYFWCSERSKLLGIELLRKMKDLLERKPTLAELTGVSESRLNSFAIYLRAYLVGSTMTNALANNVLTFNPAPNTSVESSELGLSAQLSIGSLKPSRYRQNGSQGIKNSPIYQDSLSPRPSFFKEGMPRNLSSLKGVAREKLRRRIDDLTVTLLNIQDASSSNHLDKFPEATGSLLFPPSSFLESLGKSDNGQPVLIPSSQLPLAGSSLLSPYYCWCPPVASALQFSAGTAPPVTPSFELPSLPTSLLSVNGSSSSLTGKQPLSIGDVPSLDLPPLLPEPLVRFPLPLPTSQQIPTFTPLMCDPIVHIPVIDVCSSGQGYLVSAGPAISTAIPPLHPNLVSPLIPEADSVVEKGARETLRLLISGSNQPNPPLMDVLPTVLTKSDEKQSIIVAGSRGLYIGTRDIVAAANSIASMGLVSTSDDRFSGCSVLKSREPVFDRGGSDGSGSSSGDCFPDVLEDRSN